VVDRSVRQDPTVLGGILLDFVIDAGFGEGFVERLALPLGAGLAFARAADVDAGFDFRGEEVRAVGLVGNEAAGVVAGGGDDLVGVRGVGDEGHARAHAVAGGRDA